MGSICCSILDQIINAEQKVISLLKKNKCTELNVMKNLKYLSKFSVKCNKGPKNAVEIFRGRFEVQIRGTFPYQAELKRRDKNYGGRNKNGFVTFLRQFQNLITFSG